ncbi:MAG: hypothetical protein K8R64_00095 [Methanosarcinaceae archaeon]|nr:hypothetical protein [Methanosarcinaceae archaeon]
MDIVTQSGSGIMGVGISGLYPRISDLMLKPWNFLPRDLMFLPAKIRNTSGE